MNFSESPSPSASPSTTSSSGPIHLSSFASQYPLRILMAEDDYISRRVLTLLLQRLGYKPDSVVNGRECLEYALRQPYDLILTDLDMPEMSGAECTLQLREAGLMIPIVAVTASALNTREGCFEAGMTGFLQKPVLQDDLRLELLKAHAKVGTTTPSC